MADPIYVEPTATGWRWRKAENENDHSKVFQTRGEAFEDALVERSVEPIVLLRADGSVHGELYHGRNDGGRATRVDLLAATSREDADGLGE